MKSLRILLGTIVAIAFAIVPCVAFTPTAVPVSPAGKPAVVDLPAALHIRNVGGSDGAGLCVFTSVEMAAHFQNVPELYGFQKWMTRRPGGGYPSKLDKMIASFCDEKGVAKPAYLQHSGGDEAILDLAIRTGRMPAVTYAGRDDFYRTRIAHMVDLAHLDQVDAAILDNNRSGKWIWMSRSEFLQRWRDFDGGWAVMLLAPPPPPATAEPRSFEQCPGGRCPSPASYTWDGPHGEGDRQFWILTNGGAKLGMFQAGGWYPAIGTDTYAGEAAGTPPIAPPAAAERAELFERNYGIDRSKLRENPAWSINGVEVAREQAMQAMLSDDSGRWHLTIVGDDDTSRRAAIAAIASLPGRDRVHVQGYRTADWAVAARKLQPGITLQKPRVQGGAQVYHAGEISPATAGEALKRSDPSWKPDAPPAPAPPSITPAPSNPIPQPMPGPGPSAQPLTPYTVAMLLGVVAVFFFLRGRASYRVA